MGIFSEDKVNINLIRRQSLLILNKFRFDGKKGYFYEPLKKR